MRVHMYRTAVKSSVSTAVLCDALRALRHEHSLATDQYRLRARMGLHNLQRYSSNQLKCVLTHIAHTTLVRQARHHYGMLCNGTYYD
jgi:hypothetical protein